MRNIISLAHISLDGFMAGPGGDMDLQLGGRRPPLSAPMTRAATDWSVYRPGLFFVFVFLLFRPPTTSEPGAQSGRDRRHHGSPG